MSIRHTDDKPIHFANSDELCRHIRAISGSTVLLAFSAGKDSVASWLKLVEHFDRVVPIHYEVVPGLRFVRDTLAYYERFFGQRIHIYPHPATLEMFDTCAFQAPNRIGFLLESRFTRSLPAEAIRADVEKQEKCEGAWMGVGQRASDSMHRRNSIKKYGPLRYADKWFFPVFDWRFEDITNALDRTGCKLPVDYALFNRSFDSVRYRFLSVLKDVYPDDYERILQWFPMAEAELHRRRFAREEGL